MKKDKDTNENKPNKPSKNSIEFSSNNKRLLEVLNKMMETPDDMGDEWWDDFFKDLAKYRIKI